MGAAQASRGLCLGARGLLALAYPLGSSGVLSPGQLFVATLAWGETGREVVLWEVSHQS